MRVPLAGGSKNNGANPMTDDKAAEALAKIIRDVALTFSCPVTAYVGPEATYRAEAANPDADPVDEIESWKLFSTAIIAAIRAGQVPGVEAGGWQDISLAPRDDQPLIVWQYGRRFVAEWDDEAGHWQGIYAIDGIEREKFTQEWPGRLYGPTHFRPLPAPPEPGA